MFGDQLTKHVVTSELGWASRRPSWGRSTIHRVQNSGIAFGLFSSATAVVIVLTAIAVGWMIVFFARSGSRHPVIPAALGLLIGGSVSNLVDRVRLGHVTDFLDVGWWPAFNLADTFIVLGVAILLATLVAADAKPRRPEAPPRRRPLSASPAGELNVPASAAGERLDRFLAEHVGSRGAAERAVAAGVLVDGTPRPKSYRLEGGEVLSLPEEVEIVAPPAPEAPPLAYVDEHLAVVDKPAGIVVHAGAGHAGDTLVDALAGVVGGGEPGRTGIVHRLDRDTSG